MGYYHEDLRDFGDNGREEELEPNKQPPEDKISGG